MCAVFSVICLFSNYSWAGSISFDGKSYSGDLIANAFLGAVLGTNLSEQSNIPQYIYAGNSKNPPASNRDNLKNHYPWLSSALSINTRSPDLTAVSRWNKPIKVSLGLPDAGPIYASEYNERALDARAQEIARQEIKELIPILADATGLDIDFLDTSDDLASAGANMFVALVDFQGADYWGTKYKRGPVNKIIGRPTFRTMESEFVSAIFFTPYIAPYQVDGYYAVNDKNEIQTSVCYVRDDHEVSVLKNLIRQCLMRSLGFPDLALGVEDSILSWNGPPDINKENFRQARAALDDALGAEIAEKFLLPLLSLRYVDGGNGSAIKEGYSQIDRNFLKILYSKNVRPGMGGVEIIKSICMLEEFKNECPNWKY